MHFGKLLSTVGIAIVALCASAQSACGQSETQKADPAAAPAVQQADQKKATESKDQNENKDGEKNKNKKAKGEPQQKAEPPPPEIQWATLLLDKLLSWVFLAFLFLLLFHRQLAALLESVTQAMGERGVTLEVAKVKIVVSERAQELSEDRSTRFSVSPFELTPDPYEGFADPGEIPPQASFQVGDDAASWWETRHPEYVEEASRKFGELSDRIGKVARREDIMRELVAFARALEKARFRDAKRLADLLEAHPGVRDGVLTLAKAPAHAREKILVHAAGAAYAQSASWSTARGLLEPIAWISDAPGYLPAADAWLASLYHDRIDAASKSAPDAFRKELRSTADGVVSKAEEVLEAMDNNSAWSPTTRNAAYYLRELNKLLGTISAIRADYSESTDRQKHLDRALAAHLKCTGDIAGEGPTPLDHNNLADTYRQLGRSDKTQYSKAHEELGKALAHSPEDPTFLNTQALIFIDENKLDEALSVLTAVPQTKMDGAIAQNVVQYLDNQILAAKIVSSTERPRTVRFSLAADILERAARFLDTKSSQLGEKDVARLEAELNELLGFTYLCLAGSERRSVECFERVAAVWNKVSVTAEIRWRRRVGGVRAYTWLARAARRDFDYGTAADQRKRGRKVINDNSSELSVLGVEASLPEALRLRNARVQLDTAMALQGLAEESFYGGELDDAERLLVKKDEILTALRDFREDPAIGAKIRLAAAHTGLLRGRLVFHSDPGTYEPATLTKIEKNLLAARGQGALLDCQVDLALGEAFLAAALAGKEADALANYRKAIDVLEFAVGRDAPLLRADATRALVDAYARRPAVQRRAKTKESKRA